MAVGLRHFHVVRSHFTGAYSHSGLASSGSNALRLDCYIIVTLLSQVIVSTYTGYLATTVNVTQNLTITHGYFGVGLDIAATVCNVTHATSIYTTKMVLLFIAVHDGSAYGTTLDNNLCATYNCCFVIVISYKSHSTILTAAIYVTLYPCISAYSQLGTLHITQFMPVNIFIGLGYWGAAIQSVVTSHTAGIYVTATCVQQPVVVDIMVCIWHFDLGCCQIRTLYSRSNIVILIVITYCTTAYVYGYIATLESTGFSSIIILVIRLENSILPVCLTIMRC